MTSFKKSLQFSLSGGGCVMAPLLALCSFFAHFSYNSELKQSLSLVGLAVALPLLIISLIGLKISHGKNPIIPALPGGRMSWLALAGFILSFAGSVTLGVGSLVGLVVSVVALHRICSSHQLDGQRLAMSGIGISISVMGLLMLLLFVGP